MSESRGKPRRACPFCQGEAVHALFGEPCEECEGTGYELPPKRTPLDPYRPEPGWSKHTSEHTGRDRRS